MRKPKKQKTERRVAAALRLAVVFVLLAFQVALTYLFARYLQENVAIIHSILQVAALAVAVRIYTQSGDPSYKLPWIILILFLPVTGMILHGLWGINAEQRRMRRKEADHSDLIVEAQDEAVMASLAQAQPEQARLAQYLANYGFSLYGDTHVRYFSEGAAFLDDLIACVEQAEHFVFLEYFVLAEGQLWDRLSAALYDRARHGVEVKILFDDFGNIRRFRGETMTSLREAGIEVCVFNPVHEYVNRVYFNYRDHRKIAVIDGIHAYTGGINVADEYANLIVRFGYWKDSGVRLDGDAAWGLTKAFLTLWTPLGGLPERPLEAYRPQSTCEAVGFCQPFTDGPLNNPENPGEETFLQLISGARHTLTITTPYFIPDETVMRALCIAGDGGVDVRLLMPGISDHWYTDAVAESYFSTLLAHHVKLYRYTPGLLHQKVILADDTTAFVGSINFDYRSFALHHECGVVLYGTEALTDIAQDLEAVQAQSVAVTEAFLQERKWYRRLLSSVLRLFAIWM